MDFFHPKLSDQVGPWVGERGCKGAFLLGVLAPSTRHRF